MCARLVTRRGAVVQRRPVKAFRNTIERAIRREVINNNDTSDGLRTWRIANDDLTTEIRSAISL